MSLNDQTLEGDYYNVHHINCNMAKEDKPEEKQQKQVKQQDPFSAFADAIANELFNKKPIHRRIYEGLRNSRICSAYRAIRKRR